MAAMREAEATHSASTREAEATCATTVRETEAARAAQTSKLKQAHLETMQILEDKALEEERHSCQSFLQACPNKALGILMYPIHLLAGNMSLTCLLTAAVQLTIGSRDPIPHLPTPGGLPPLHILLGISGNVCIDVRQN